MNAQKLATMSDDKVFNACIVHATKAIEYKDEGNLKMMEAHTALLEKCAQVGRARGLKGGHKVK